MFKEMNFHFAHQSSNLVTPAMQSVSARCQSGRTMPVSVASTVDGKTKAEMDKPKMMTRAPRRSVGGRDGAAKIGMVAGLISERWPASTRNPGRLHLGTPGRIKSESAIT
jgi:hypothetical protein